MRVLVWSLLAATGALSIASCGTAGHSVIRVGDTSITDVSVHRQMSAMARGHVLPDPPRFGKCVARLQAETPESFPAQLKQECRDQYASLKQEAISSLISLQWLIGAAKESGLTVPDGPTASKAKMIEAQLRRAVGMQEPRPTATDLTAYYQRHIESYEHPEQRNLYIIEHIPTRREARALLVKAKRRGTLANIAVAPVIALHESVPRSDPSESAPTRRAALRAIFAARPHTLVGPVPLNEQWCLFEVTSIAPRTVEPVAEVKPTIERQLAVERQRHALSRFIGEWRKRWTARTDCSTGYVVQKCRQFRGRRASDPFAFD